MVKEARREEMEYVRKMHPYDKVHISECKRATGKMPITVRWIDINKGDKDKPNYRSRIVARELNTYKRDDLFAAPHAAGGTQGDIVHDSFFQQRRSDHGQ